MIRILLAVLVAGFVTAAPRTATAKDQIVISELNWTGAVAIEHVLKEVMEQKLDADVSIVVSDYPVTFASMDKGDGGIDVITDLWMPNLANYWARYIAPGSKESVLVNDKPYTGEQGLYIPGYIQDQYGVKSVEDLKKPEIAKLFDTEGTGKGVFYPGPIGPNSSDVEVVKAKSYGYDKLFSPIFIDDVARLAKIDAAFKKKQAILFFFWRPEWVHSAYDLRKLQEPPFDGYAMDSKKDDPRYKPDGCWNMITSKEDPDWLNKSHVACAWPSATVYVGYSKSLTTRSPKIARFLKQVSFDTATVDQWILKVGRDKMPPDQMAKEWVEQNPSKVAEWLNGIN
jgi:glycine betaine/proline transport system substrate-binding protein